MGICLIEDGQDSGHRPTAMHEALRKRVAAEIERQGREMKEVSLAAGLGETYVRDFLKRGRGKVENLLKVAEVLGHDQAWLMTGVQDLTSRAVLQPFRPQVVPGSELVGARDFPIYAAAEGGNGHLIVNFDPIEVVKRPAILEGVKGAYGLLVSGDSMEPAYDHGDMALVHPGLGPGRLVDVVLYDHPPNGDAEAIIKRMVGWTEREWHLRQFNPAKDFPAFRADWPTCHRVVGKYARR